MATAMLNAKATSFAAAKTAPRSRAARLVVRAAAVPAEASTLHQLWRQLADMLGRLSHGLAPAPWAS